MRIGDYEIEWHGDVVEITGAAGTVAKGRWSQGRLVDRAGVLRSDADDAGEWLEIEAAVRREADAYISATVAAAYDERGVDVTQIDHMLSLSPRERLESLDRHRRSILRLMGDAPRD